MVDTRRHDTRNCAGGVTPWARHQRGDAWPRVDLRGGSGEGRSPAPSRTWGSSTTRPRWSIRGHPYQTEGVFDCGFYKFVQQAGQAHSRRAALHAQGQRSSPTPISAAAFRSARRGTCRGADRRSDGGDHVHVRPGRLPPPSRAPGGATARNFPVHQQGQPSGRGRSSSTTRGTRPSSSSTTRRPSTDSTIRSDVTVTPRSGLLLCEDNAGGQQTATQQQSGASPSTTWCWLPAEVPAGDYRQNEWAGACSPTARGCSRTSRRRGSRSALRGAGPL